MHNDLDYDLDYLFPPTPPIPRSPLDDAPAARPDLHVERIAALMGWTRDPARMRPCSAKGCLARPGADCTTDSGRRMRGVHPTR